MMRQWLERWEQRQKDLARGVDSGLVQANRRRYRVSMGLLISSIVLAEAVSEAGVSGIVGWIFRVMAAIGCISGLFLLQWAWQERIHLNKPDPEKPLSIKDRK
ncbi:MAG: hypothetical protein DMG13_33050 [Acidobacteria bacterium]|nr:MAG: hypothetical protein DMG13_33050 [Acidobacteriota bacterium]